MHSSIDSDRDAILRSAGCGGLHFRHLTLNLDSYCDSHAHDARCQTLRRAQSPQCGYVESVIFHSPPLYCFLDLTDAYVLAASCTALWASVPLLLRVRVVQIGSRLHGSDHNAVRAYYGNKRRTCVPPIGFVVHCAQSGGLRHAEFLCLRNTKHADGESARHDWVATILQCIDRGTQDDEDYRCTRATRCSDSAIAKNHASLVLRTLYVTNMMRAHVPHVGHSIRSVVLGADTHLSIIIDLLSLAGRFPSLRSVSHESSRLSSGTLTAAVQEFANTVAHREKLYDTPTPPLRYNANSGAELAVSDFRCGICHTMLFRHVDTFAAIACEYYHPGPARRVFLKGSPVEALSPQDETSVWLLCPNACHAQYVAHLIAPRSDHDGITLGMPYLVNCNPAMVYFNPSDTMKHE